MPDDRQHFTVRRYAIPRASLPGQAEPLSDDAVHALLMEHQRRETDAFWSGILGVPYKPDAPDWTANASSTNSGPSTAALAELVSRVRDGG